MILLILDIGSGAISILISNTMYTNVDAASSFILDLT